ncbi:MAG: four-carbon acid sugar kinase family protein [Lachnospiraceae bacterium]
MIKAKNLDQYAMPDLDHVNLLMEEELIKDDHKIIVLDDDPTGVQTVHDISVYTDWSLESIRSGFQEENKLFFILTNSRGFTESQTINAHREITERVCEVAREYKKKFMIISRSDSTLRGHFPLETETIRSTLIEQGMQEPNAEILCPFFKEGGRFTLNNVHYVRSQEELIPAAMTEFAEDETFGYQSSNLTEYVEEKTKGKYKKEDCITISLEELRSMDLTGIEQKLLSAKGFQKIIVNAIDDVDVRLFCISLYRAMQKGHVFLLRTAAALVKAIGFISDQPLLERSDMVRSDSNNGGIIVAGSHTKKTTEQLQLLHELENIVFLEMNSDLVLYPGELEKETERLLRLEEDLIRSGRTVCVATKRTLLTLPEDTPETALLRSVAISEALQACVGRLTVVPSFVIAKGGITSSDVGTKALLVKKALVLGQIQPGVPVWQTGSESRFPGIPYVIFPGNVGAADTLKIAVSKLVS